MNENVRILVCVHKKDYVYDKGAFYPIQVGKALSNVDLGFCGDDTGDNISGKNGSYCELTAMYWAWKNLKDADVIGLNHYRRYFDMRPLSWLRFRESVPVTVEKMEKYQSGRRNDFERLLGKADIILSKRKFLPRSVFTNYCYWHVSDDLRTLRAVVQELEPDYAASFDKVMRKRSLSPYNMFVCRRGLFDDYCRWLFGILSEVEKRVNIDNYSAYQKRVFGFMAERLLNVYVLKNRLRKKTFPVFFVK